MILELFLVALGAYLIGSIPFGLLLTRAAGLGDIRSIGSGNIGATNVLRTGNKKLAALTLFLDGFKGWVVVFGIQQLSQFNMAITDQYEKPLSPHVTSAAIIAVIVGHCLPLWLKFKGGKGVATTLGAAIGLNPLIGLSACATWLVMAILFRISSLAALVAIAALPSFAWYLGYSQYILPLILIAVLVFIRHHENIKRLLAGTEPKIGQKK